MVATPVVLVSIVFNDVQGAVRVIFDQDPVRIGGTLFLFVRVEVLVSLALIGGHKRYFLFFVAREDRMNFFSNGQLVKLGTQLRRLENLLRVLSVGAV